MIRPPYLKTWIAGLCLAAGLAASGTATQARQTSDDEDAKSDALMCMGAYYDVLQVTPDDFNAKQGMLIASDAYKKLTGESDDDIAKDTATYADTITQLDADGIQSLDDTRVHCDALFMFDQPMV